MSRKVIDIFVLDIFVLPGPTEAMSHWVTLRADHQECSPRGRRCALEAFIDFDRRSVEFSDATETQPVQIPFPAHSVEWYKALALSCGPYSNDQWSTDISLGISLLERDDLRQDARVAAHVAAVATHFRWHPCPKKHLRWDKDRSRP